jgi:hypothetical protein
LWSNSGTARIGFHALAVWQFWHGVLKFPCGLCVPADSCALPEIPEAATANSTTSLKTPRDAHMTGPLLGHYNSKIDGRKIKDDGCNSLST